MFSEFPDLVGNSRTITDIELNIQLKLGDYRVKQKAGPIPLQLQDDKRKYLEKLIKAGHLEWVNNVDADCFA